MPTSIELRPTGALRRKIAFELLLLALAVQACGQKEDPQSGPDGSQGLTDVSASNDTSTKPDMSAEPDGGAQPPRVDAGGDETAPPADGTHDSEDASRDTHDAGVVPDSIEPGDGDIADALDAHDSVEPTDVGIGDARDAPLDSVVGTADADVGDAGPVPIFPECTYSALLGGLPDMIVDATFDWAYPFQTCSCTTVMYSTANRVLCGPRLTSIDIAVGCTTAPQRGYRSIFQIYIRSCTFPTPLDGGKFGSERPLTDWDALLAEQIAGHSDGGATIDAAEGGSGDGGNPSGDSSVDSGAADGDIQDGASGG